MERLDFVRLKNDAFLLPLFEALRVNLNCINAARKRRDAKVAAVRGDRIPADLRVPG